MKQTILYILPLFLMSSCSLNIEIEQDDNDEFTSVVMDIPSFDHYDTDDSSPAVRNSAVLQDDGSFLLVWSEDDFVGIFPDKGSQIYFSMASGAGQSSASFDGGGWALKKGSGYYSYFPFIPDFYIDKAALPLVYTGQSQNGNADPDRADLGKYGYMVSKGIADVETGSLYFSYSRLVVLVTAKIPVHSGTYSALTIRTDDPVILQSGTTNVVDMSLTVEDGVYDDNLRIDFENLTFTEDATLVANMLISPMNILNKQLTFELTDSEGMTSVSSVRGRDYKTTTKYTHSPHFSISPSQINLIGDAGTFELDLNAISESYSYNIAADVDWLTPSASNGTGSAKIPVNATANNTGQKRTGHIVISETVNVGSANETTLNNVITVTQDVYGMNVGVSDWESDDIDYGGVAQ